MAFERADELRDPNQSGAPADGGERAAVRGEEIRCVPTPVILPSGATVAAPLVVRVAGLPTGTLRAMRFERSFGMASELARLREWLATEGNALADALYPVIGEPALAPVKPALVGLRRSLHRVRMPKTREWNDDVAGELPNHLVERIRTWLDRLREADRLHAALPEELASETTAKQQSLREAASDPMFRRALSWASPALFAELTKWLDDERRRPQRQSLIRLAKYLARAATKTSPYSTFTVIGTGTWSADGPPVRFSGAEPEVRSVLELNGLVSQWLVRSWCEDQRIVDELPLRVNPSATERGHVVRFLGASLQEPIIDLPVTPPVRAVLDALRSGEVLRVPDLLDRLGAGAKAVQARRFLDQLISSGLVERRLPVADLGGDPLGELAAWLTAKGGLEFADAVTTIEHVRKELDGPAAISDVAGHVEHQRTLGEAIDGLVERVGAPPQPMVGDSVETCCEDAVFPDPVAECSVPRWRPALEDLEVLRRVFGVLDPTLPLRVALGAYCAERFGTGSQVPLVELHRTIAEELARGDSDDALREIAGFLGVVPTPLARLGDSGLERLRALDRMQAELRAIMRPAPDGVLRGDARELAELAESWPEWVRAPRSVGCYVQAVPGDELRLVINAAHIGYGRGRSRSLHLIRRAGGTSELGRVGGDEAALAELSGMFGFSPNVREPSVPYEIDYPFTSSPRPAEQRIPLGNLVATHDPSTNLVRLTTSGLDSEVTPLHLGMMSDGLLPPVARLLTQAFGSTYYVHPSQPLLVSAEMLTMPEGVVEYPRVEVGRVVLRRARWIVPSELIPVRRKGEGDADYLVRLLGWLRAEGLPDRCFVRMWAEDLRTAGWPTTKLIANKSRKPVYVDFANWYLVAAFERMLGGPGPVVIFEEPLPAPEDALGPDPRNPSVAEYLVELSAPEVIYA